MNKQALVLALETIRNGVELALAILLEEDEPAGCAHPRRVVTRTFGGRGGWNCPDCGASDEDEEATDATSND